MRRLILALALALGLVGSMVGAEPQRATGRAQATAPAPSGSPAQPVANPLFQDTRLVPVHLTFAAKEFDGLRPIRTSGGGGSQSWLQGAEGKRNGLSASRGIEFPWVHAAASIDGRTVEDIGVRFKGNGTFMLGQNVNKISMKLAFNEFVKGRKLGTLKTVNLHSNVTDGSYSNEVLAFRLFRAAGVPAPRTAYAPVHLTVTGRSANSYYGLFTLVENPDEPFVAARGLPETGAIFKPVTSSLFADLGRDWRRYNQTYDPKTTLTPAQQQRVMDFAGIVTRASDTEFAAKAPEYLDLDNTARFLAVTVWLSDIDGILGSGQNYYVYLDPRTNRFSFMAWDQDHSFGQFFRGSQRDRERLSIDRPWSGTNRFLDRLFKLPAFKTAYLRYIEEFGRTLFAPDRLAAQVDAIAVLIRPAVKAESGERLRRLEETVAGRRPHVDDQMFDEANTPIKPFIKARAQSIAEQLARMR